MTNYEKIKNMSIDEMENIINPYITCAVCERPDMCCLWRCKLTVKKWLESEAEE